MRRVVIQQSGGKQNHVLNNLLQQMRLVVLSVPPI